MKGLENVKSSQLKKVQYKDGGVVAEFFDEQGNQITVKSVDVPHPDFRNAFGSLVHYLELIMSISTEATWIEPTAVEFKDCDKIVLRGEVHTEFAGTEIKTEPLSYAELRDTPISDVFNAIDRIKDETKKFLFEGKEAQQSLFPMQHDGADGARALLAMTGTN